MFILLFFLGVLGATQLSSLPDPFWLLAIIPLLLLLLTKYRVIAPFFLGFLWVVGLGIESTSHQLSEQIENKKVLVIGEVSSLPKQDSRKVRFNFKIEQLMLDGVNIQGPQKIRMSWYRNTAEVRAGEQWQFYIKLKRVNGMMNPGTFDYERWAFEQGIDATAYVIDGELNKQLSPASFFSVNGLRGKLKENVTAQMEDKPLRGIVLALLLGDRSEITEQHWDVLTATGTNHLVAISGLHIGLVAGAVFFLCRVLFRRLGIVLLYIPAHKAAALAALFAAFIYAMLAGFAIPTQRALVMILVVMVSVLVNRKNPTSMVLSIALFAVLLIDPFSVLSAGFWLSFAAVAAILYAMQSRWRMRGWWWKWGRVQWIVTIALIPILMFSFQQFSIISPVANFFAVPWVSFLVVPLVLVAGLLSFIPPISELLFYLSHELLLIMWQLLIYFSELPFSQWHQFMPVGWTFVPAAIGIALFLGPRGLPGRYVALLLCLPLFLLRPDRPEQNEAWFTLLDVGQGLAAVVQTTNHLLLFDTGPKFSADFNTGQAVILPYLRAKGITKIDTIVISHGDNDHIGGLKSVMEHFPGTILLSGDMKKTAEFSATPCVAGERWEWDGVVFEMLHPLQSMRQKAGNNGSCVLRVSAGGKSVLITGDIEKRAEKNLVEISAMLKSDILVVPHHGSNTSSTAEFIDAVDPVLALYPVGYSNRYGFPKANVVARYTNNSVAQFTTGNGGALSIVLNKESTLNVNQYRIESRRFWHRQ